MPTREPDYKVIPQDISDGIHTDNDPLNQPRGTSRYTFCGVDESITGKQGSISNERSNYLVGNITSGYKPIGDRYIEDDLSVILSVNPVTGYDEIGIITKDHRYTTLVSTQVIGFDIRHQCEIEYRLRRGRERVIYWVDAHNVAKTYNLDRPHNFYTVAFQEYLKSGGNPATYPLDKYDGSSFDLIKVPDSIPFFSNVEISETGAILPGSYNFAIQLVDEDLNPTEWITTSNIVRIFNDQLTSPFHTIRGSRNVNTSSQSFPRANKSIILTLTNLDTSFPYYRIAIIRAAGNIGTPDKVLISDINTTTDSRFIYSGNDSALAEGTLADILVDNEVIFAPQHITQLENRLQLYNTKGSEYNWCEFQKFASKIGSKVALKEVVLNNVISEPNIKNAKSTFMYGGYMPGEVYSFSVHYVFPGNLISPGFHIPGKSSTNIVSDMKLHELNTRYIDTHNCSTSNYWGLDVDGNSLVGKRVRHHRFPFRTELGIPLYEKSDDVTTINKFRLKINITLNPAWTGPTPPDEYPEVGGEPAVISFTFNYQITGSPNLDSISGNLVDTEIGSDIILYDSFEPLDEINPGEHAELDPACELATLYQLPGNERFLIAYTYETYPASSSINNYTSDILGIEFSNIEKPHPDCIGIYIMRNERTEDDRLIIDNAIFGPMTQFEQYRSFGLITPKQYYAVDNCGRPAAVSKTLQYTNRSMWFWNPEFQFFNKKTEFSSVHIEASYDQTSVDMPTISNTDGSTCNGGPPGSKPGDQGSRGVYVQDVQAGTSYNPEVHKGKDKDDDGFDLVIGYRNTNVGYNPPDIDFPAKDRVIYLSAASYQNYGENTYYNVSVDNKIGMYVMGADFDISVFIDGFNNSLKYGSLIRENDTSYSNFMTRPYYKEHNNPIYFGTHTVLNGVRIFNGDASISGFNFVSTVFYDMVVGERAKKSQLWKIIVGAVLIVAAVVVTVATVGTGTPAAIALVTTALATLAISYGVSLAVSGIKFEQMKSMIDVDYEKGLKETVVDGGVWETIRDTIQREDDTIRWFADRVSNLFIESAVPVGLRSGLTCGVPDFIDAPVAYDEAGYRTYLIEKLTTIDRDQGSGRMYKGYATAELYDMNLDYMRFNKEKLFIHLPLEYDCCSDNIETFPMRVWYSQQSFQEERVDNYRVFLPNNYRDIEGEHGEITEAYRLGNNLFIHTKEALWHLPQNNQERVTGEIISFVGTGEFFSVPPRKVVDDDNGSGGTQHKWGTVKTKYGVFFIDEIEGKIYLHSDKLNDLTKGNKNWFKNNLKSFLSHQLYIKLGVDFGNRNNPANRDGTGYLSAFDSRYERILLTKKDYLVVPDKLATLVLLEAIPSTNVFAYNSTDGLFYQGSTVIHLDNQDYFENRSWTMSYSFHRNKWRGWHPYLPNYYVHGKSNLYSFIFSSDGIWKHNRENHFQTFYTYYFPFIVEYVNNNNPLSTSITEDLTLQTRAYTWDAAKNEFVEQDYITFNKILAWNGRQSSGEQVMVVKDTQPDNYNWLQQQIINNPGTVLITKKEKNWNINDLRDYVIDYDKPLFDSSWNAIKSTYPIDKVVNPASISLAKPWQDLQNFRDKYVVIRLKFDSFDYVNLIMNYSLETEQNSSR